MKSNDKKSTAIIVLFVVVLFLSWTAIVNEFVLLVINPRNYSEYFYLNMTLTHNYINTIYYDLELSGFSYFMIYLIFSAVDVLPGLGGIIGATKKKEPHDQDLDHHHGCCMRIGIINEIYRLGINEKMGLV